MTRKLFREHLQALSDGTNPVNGIYNIADGEDESEFTFQLVFDDLLPALTITAMIQPSLEEYPNKHEYIFCVDDDVSPEISAILESSSSTLSGKTLFSALQHLVRNTRSDSLFATPLTANDLSDVEMMDAPFDDDDEFDHDDNEIELPDGYMTDPEDDPHYGTAIENLNPSPGPRFSRSNLLRLAQDLMLVKRAGFKVSYSSNVRYRTASHVFISIRASKLGLSEDALEAWSIDKRQYLVLAIRYNQGYKSFDDIIEYRTSSRLVDFKVGLCFHYRPDLDEFVRMQRVQANLLTSTLDDKRSTHHQSKKNNKDRDKAKSNQWLPSFVSTPLEDLLNKSFMSILHARIDHSLPWYGAEKYHFDSQTTSEPQSVKPHRYAVQEVLKKTFPFLDTDHLAETTLAPSRKDSPITSTHRRPAANSTTPTHHTSFPLVVMQFFLRRFLRCTEFCLVCHDHLSSNIDAIRPYVCDKPLCLYQYMSLGFGPEIEHEICSQPEVVDLLISMCWASARQSKLKNYPTGLDLKVPDIGVGLTSAAKMALTPLAYEGASSSPEPLPAEASSESGKLYSDDRRCDLYCSRDDYDGLEIGDWVALCFGDAADQDYVHVKVTGISRPYIHLSRLHLSTTATSVRPREDDHASKKAKLTDGSPVTIHPYDVSLDSLGGPQKCLAILQQLDLLPCVAEMKDWLENHPGHSLAHWKERFSPAALGILRWIIASNRSCILPAKSSERVGGMAGWKQFRFAMGAPDKEQRFHNALNDPLTIINAKFPTFFAFHGSRLWNWHSIVREGLRFDYVAVGRSYGDGVYHSRQYDVSYSYSGQHGSSSHVHGRDNFYLGNHWRQSSIKPLSVISLSEIINAPTHFVSTTPHIVIDKLDWIQVRYLFVNTKGGAHFEDRNDDDGQDKSTELCIQQDPEMVPTGINHTPLTIPVTAIPLPRRPKGVPASLEKQKIITEMKQKYADGLFRRLRMAKYNFSKPRPPTLEKAPVVEAETIDDAVSVGTQDEDLDIFEGVDVVNEPLGTALAALKAKFEHSRLAEGSVQQSNRVLQAGSGAARPDGNILTPMQSPVAATARSSTNFVGGKLDFKTLTILRAPSDASPSTTRQLTNQIKSLTKAQETVPSTELGWFMDFSNLENLYQWIVELHSFPSHLPLTKEMVARGVPSVVLEVRFSSSYPFSPPFIRVIRPRFLPFLYGGGGHVTAGGSICMELLTTEGWLATYDMASVLMQVRMAICSEDPRPAKLAPAVSSYGRGARASEYDDYSIHEALDGYARACRAHNWKVPTNMLEEIRAMGLETV